MRGLQGLAELLRTPCLRSSRNTPSALGRRIFALLPEVDTTPLLQGKLEVLLASRASKVGVFVLTPQPHADMSGVDVRDVANEQMSGAASRTSYSVGMRQLLYAAPLSGIEPSHARSPLLNHGEQHPYALERTKRVGQGWHGSHSLLVPGFDVGLADDHALPQLERRRGEHFEPIRIFAS